MFSSSFYTTTTSINDPAYWSRADIQELARERIMTGLSTALRRNVILSSPEVFHNWETYMECYSEVGGVIEATPAEVMGHPCVDLLIEPTGNIRILATHEQIHARPYVVGGASFPAQSVPHDALVGASEAICEVLRAQGVLGRVCIDFVTFWDEVNEAQKLWAVDLKLNMSPTSCSTPSK